MIRLKNPWAALALILFAMIFAVFAITGLISWLPSEEVTYQPVMPRFEIRHWVNEARLPQPPPVTAQERFEKIAKSSKKRPVTEPSDIVSPELPKKLHRARKLIQACGPVAEAWQWEAVKKVVDSFGKSLPIYYMKKETYWNNGGNFGMAYREEEERLLIPIDVAEKTDEEVASGLVHEATHAVMFRESLKASGYKAEELSKIHQACWDVHYEHFFATETLAHYNQARWIAQCVKGTDARPNAYFENSWALAADGDYTSQGNLSQYIEKYVDTALGFRKTSPDKLCGPLIMIRGDRAGQYFFSADLYLELIGPLMGAREKITQRR